MGLNQNDLTSLGLTNDLLSEQDLISKSAATYAAYCTSLSCAGNNYRKVRINVKGKPIDCPICGHVLIYKIDRQKPSEYAHSVEG